MHAFFEITEPVPKKEQSKKKRGRPRKNKDTKDKNCRKKTSSNAKTAENSKYLKNRKIIEKKSIILTLPINIEEYEKRLSMNFEKSFLQYEPLVPAKNEEPSGFNIDTFQDGMTLEPELLSDNQSQEEEKISYEMMDRGNRIRKNVSSIGTNIQQFNVQLSNDVHCHHCCHKFKTKPCGIPKFIDDDNIFHVTGIFCSFNCALTFNNNSNEYENVIQERESMLYLLYRECNEFEKLDYEIRPAPERETLKMFGGPLTIEEFRKNVSTYTVVHPPLISLLPQLEENKIIMADTGSKQLKIKTNKKVKKNTLEYMFSHL